MDGVGPSQMLPSQASIANTEVFRKSTLPELSPMSYSLTANYPFPSENEGLYLNALPASTLSLRQPTMFGLSLQHEESKSNQGSRLSIHGSRPSIHGSRPSIHGSRPSIHESRPSIHESRPSIYSSRGSSTGLQGSRHMLHSSGTSSDLLLKYGKEHCVDDEANERDTVSLGNHTPSPIPFAPTKSESMEVPTRDSSPMPRPLVMASSHQLGGGRKDFASLTCIANENVDSLPGSPEPEEEVEPRRLRSPTHKMGRGKRDLTTLTALPEGAVPEEEKGEEGAKDKDIKESSPGIKKGRSKTMSRLEKLTSLDYIRQSFRIKKKKVSFQNVKTPETTPTPPKKSVKKSSPVHNGKALTNDSGLDKMAADSRERRISAASTDMFSPNEEYLRHHQPYTDHMMGVAPGMYAQLSQPNYYVPAQYAYPQLSQQYYPQLSQGYGNPYGTSPYHQVPLNDYRAQREPPGNRYQEVITPDYSDITSPDRENFRGHSPEPNDRQGSEYSYELRPRSPVGYKDGDTSPDSMEQPSPVRRGEPHPDYMRGPAHYDPYLMGSPQRYGMPGYGAGPGLGLGPGHRGSMDYEGHRRRSSIDYDGQRRRSSGEQRSSIDYDGQRRRSSGEQQEMLINSISVDNPHPYPATNRTHQPRMGRRYSGYSESSMTSDPTTHSSLRMDQRYSGYSESSTTSDTRELTSSGKGRVSWSSEVKEHPA